MAASATSLSTFSSLHSLRPPRFSLLTQLPPPPPSYLSSSFSPLSLPSHPTNKLTPLLATPSDSDDIDADADTDTDKETEDDNPVFFETLYSDYDDGDVPQFVPRQPPEGYVPPPAFDELPPEDEETIAAAYEELYGPAYSGVSVLGNDVRVMDSKMLEDPVWGPDEDAEDGGVKDGLEERVVQVRRVTKVVKGGKQLHFRAVVVVGDKKGIVGVGVGKAKEVIAAVRKSGINARRNLITVPMTKYMTFPHRADGVFGAAKVMLRPACPGTGVLAGGSVRIVLELAGVENALGKQLGSDNALNNARATIVAVRQMRQFSEVAAERGIPMEEMWK